MGLCEVNKMDIGMRIWDMYCDWLYEMYPDEVHTNEDLVEITREGRHYDQFIQEINLAIKRNSDY